MTKHIQAVKDKIVVQMVVEEKMTEGGIVIPETAEKDPQLTCFVISVGDEVTKEITQGSTVYCHRKAGMDMMIKGKIYKVLTDGEVYATVSQDVG